MIPESQAIVVLTYPGHFFITGLCIQHTLKQQKHLTQVPIFVIVDDVSIHAWPSYVDDCQLFYQSLTTRHLHILKVSDLPEARRFEGNPWIRQQIVKLYCDRLIPYQSWFFIDGDNLLMDPIYDHEVPHDHVPWTKVTAEQYKFVGDVLKIIPGIRVGYRRVGVSSGAFRNMQSHTLQSLRSHCEHLHNKEFVEIIKDFENLNGRGVSVSEWELIEHYRFRVLELELDLVTFYPWTIGNSQDPRFKPGLRTFKTHWNKDTTLSKEWWAQQGIEVDSDIWELVNQVER